MKKNDIEKIISSAHNRITRTKGNNYAPTSYEIQKQIDMEIKTQTAMRQLLEQIKEESRMDKTPSDWSMCLKSLAMVIENTYLKKEKEQMMEFANNYGYWLVGHDEKAEKYYNEMYGE